MAQKIVDFHLTGMMPLLMNSDDIDAADRLAKWRKDNKKLSVPGDDRSPPWTWTTKLYSDGVSVVMPGDNIMAALRKAGSQITLKKQTTFKSLSQSGLIIKEHCDFRFGEKQSALLIKELPGEDADFAAHAAFAENRGFVLFKKRARVGTAKHIRVRPQFDQWTVTGQIHVLSDEINQETLTKLFEFAGREGLGDWRPGGKTPGPFGQFTATVG